MISDGPDPDARDRALPRMVPFAGAEALDHPAIVPVRPVPRRAFQGWRYLDAADAPPDLAGGSGSDIAAMPPKLRRELAELGLL